MNKHAAIFSTPQGECFFPYDQIIFDTKSEAKEWGRREATKVSQIFGLTFTGRTLKIDGIKKWPGVILGGETEDQNIHVCICGGEIYNQLSVEDVAVEIADVLNDAANKQEEKHDNANNEKQKSPGTLDNGINQEQPVHGDSVD